MHPLDPDNPPARARRDRLPAPAPPFARARRDRLPAPAPPYLLAFAAMEPLRFERVGVIGLGYVGLPLAVAFANAGCEVVAVDSDRRRVDAIRAHDSYVEDVPSRALSDISARTCATTHYRSLAIADAIVICVPTPLSENREPDLAPLIGSCTELAKVLREGQLVVLESTTYPGTTRETVAPLLEQSGLRAGDDFNLAFSPERVDPGRTDFTLANTPKVLGGLTPACGDRAQALYQLVCEQIVRVSTPEAAELTKLLENIFRSVNIALVNELALLTDRMGIDIREVVQAAATKPYGFMRFDPGPGMGGHCLPVDPFYLSWRARQFGISTEFIELAGKVNQEMPRHCVKKVSLALNDLGRAVNGAKIAIFGVSYKPGVGDIRESPALRIMALLASQGADLRFHDPHVVSLPPGALTLAGGGGYERAIDGTSFEEALEGIDLAVIVTAHPGVDHEAIAERADAVVDLRGVLRGLPRGVPSSVVGL
ncbi:MAG: nucleotide sugar dehydrogenase [Solirubrobacteraceae bacterium]